MGVYKIKVKSTFINFEVQPKKKLLSKKTHNNNNISTGNIKNFQPELTVKSPGRINFIGEHTDYNNGFVLPTAIDRYITLYFSANSSEFDCNIYSKTYSKGFSFDLRKVSRSGKAWQNYILGVVSEIQKLGKNLRGFDCVIESDLPVGAGISSSAALECGFGFGLNKLFNFNLSRETIAEISRNAEHNYVGTKCGIMDQYSSILSKEGYLILLDCKSMEPVYVPAEFEGYKILLLNTMVSHSLADSEYNTRRTECEQVIDLVQKSYPAVKSLRDINLLLLNELQEELSDVLYKRGRYVIKENERVLEAVEALKRNELKSFGNLMYQSHDGLSKNYEVSCKELDFLVEFSRDFDYILGSRMMGGGFGGCTINLVKEEKVEEYVEQVKEAYSKEFEIELEAITVVPSGGTHLVEQ